MSASNTAEVNTYIDNEVSQKITQRTVQEIANKVDAQQKIIISGDRNIVNNFSQDQTMKLVYQNSQQVLNKLKSVQAIENSVDVQAETTQTNPIAAVIDSVFSGITNLGALWMIIIVVAMIVGAVVLINGGPLAMLLDDDNGDNGDNGDNNVNSNQSIQNTYGST